MTKEKKLSLKEFLKEAIPKPYVLDLPNAGTMIIKHLSYGDSGALHQMVFDKKITTDAEIIAQYLARVGRTQCLDGTEGSPPDPQHISEEDLRIFARSALTNDEKISEVIGDPIAELARRLHQQWQKDDERADQLVKAANDWVSPLTKSLLAQADQANDFVQSLISQGATQTLGVTGIMPGDIGLPSILKPSPSRLTMPDIDIATNPEHRTARATEDLLIVAKENLELGRGVANQFSSMYAFAKSWNADLAKRQDVDMKRRAQDEKAVRRSIAIAAWSLVAAVAIGVFACVLAYRTLAVAEDALTDALESGQKSLEAASEAHRASDRLHDDLQALLRSSIDSRTELKQTINDFKTSSQLSLHDRARLAGEHREGKSANN